MAGNMPEQPADHAKMACCTSDCTMVGSVGLAQLAGADVSTPEPTNPPLYLVSIKELDSLNWATVDPPPRLNLR